VDGVGQRRDERLRTPRAVNPDLDDVNVGLDLGSSGADRSNCATEEHHHVHCGWDVDRGLEQLEAAVEAGSHLVKDSLEGPGDVGLLARPALGGAQIVGVLELGNGASTAAHHVGVEDVRDRHAAPLGNDMRDEGDLVALLRRVRRHDGGPSVSGQEDPGEVCRVGETVADAHGSDVQYARERALLQFLEHRLHQRQ